MNIYESITKVMAEIGAVGKDSKNQKQGFMYRGIDAVMNALNPALVKYKVFVVPEVLEQTREERVSSNNNALIYTVLKVKYRFYAEDGSFVETTVIGEGMDSGDKSANKAMSVALKYAAFQLFMIPTEEMVDPDADSHEVKSKNAKAEPKPEPRTQKPATEMPITPEEKVALLKEMNRTGMTKDALLKWAKCDTIDDLTRAQCAKTLAQLKTFPNADEGQNK